MYNEHQINRKVFWSKDCNFVTQFLCCVLMATVFVPVLCFAQTTTEAATAATAATAAGGEVQPALPAAPTDPYTVAGIKVNESGESAVAAREKAINAGAKQAYASLLQRLNGLTEAAAFAMVKDTDEARILDSMDSFEVQQEHTTSLRYQAIITYKFSASKIRPMMAARSLKIIEPKAKPVFILPIYQSAKTVALWEDPNPWRNFWEQNPKGSALVPVSVPLGDISDIRDISVDAALQGTPANIATMQGIAGRYGADGILVSLISKEDNNASTAATRLSLYYYTGGQLLKSDIQVLDVTGKTEDAILADAKARSVKFLEDSWKSKSTSGSAASDLNGAVSGGVISVRILIEAPSFAELEGIRKSLQQLNAVSGLKTVTIGYGYSEVEIQYIGDTNSLKLAMSQIGFDLVPTQIAGRAPFKLQRLAASPSPATIFE